VGSQDGGRHYRASAVITDLSAALLARVVGCKLSFSHRCKLPLHVIEEIFDPFDRGSNWLKPP